MLEQYVGDSSTTLTQMGYGTAEINGIPVDDGADDKVEARGTECLTFDPHFPSKALISLS